MSPAPPFAGATGRGVRIAVIDSGVNPAHPHIGSVAGGVAIGVGGMVVEGLDAALDQLGHGTAVMAAIQEKAPDAACYAVRVFHASLRTTGLQLVEAIHWCAAQRIDIINLSLGSTNSAHVPAFTEAVEGARAAGALLVAAREADGVPCYPGALAGVLGVGLDWDCPREGYRIAGDAFHATGYPRPIPGVPERRNLYGISFAVANMSGIAARALEQARAEGVADRLAERLLTAAQTVGSKSAGACG